MNRMTIGLALRYDHFQHELPRADRRPGARSCRPATSAFPEQDNLNWKDITYRTGFTYDVMRQRQDRHQGHVQQVPARPDAQQARQRIRTR